MKNPTIQTLGKSATTVTKYITYKNNQGGALLPVSANYHSRGIQSNFSPVEKTVGNGEEQSER